MTMREFYTVAEAAKLLGCDVEAVRQQITMRRWPTYVELGKACGWWFDLPDHPRPPQRGDTEFSQWFGHMYGEEDERLIGLDMESAVRGVFFLDGWFRIGPRIARQLALSVARAPGSRHSVYAVCGDGDPQDLSGVSWSCRLDLDLDSLRLRGRDLMAVTQPPLLAVHWPWGEHETELLRHMAAAAQRCWAPPYYDPADLTTAPTNEQVVAFLRKLGVTEKIAKSMATILRSDGLPSGRRPTK